MPRLRRASASAQAGVWGGRVASPPDRPTPPCPGSGARGDLVPQIDSARGRPDRSSVPRRGRLVRRSEPGALSYPGAQGAGRRPPPDSRPRAGRRPPGRCTTPGHEGLGAAPALIAAPGEAAVLHDVPPSIEGIDVGPEPTPFQRAQRLAADAWGARRSWFL